MQKFSYLELLCVLFEQPRIKFYLVFFSHSTENDYNFFSTKQAWENFTIPEHPGSAWILIARFSNSDDKNWMRDDGHWWYDQNVPIGTPDPSVNADMISPAFWLASGNDFKITRSDDSSHISLLRTTDNCLGGQTFRSKITSYGDFRNGTVWSNDTCLGRCTIQYGGQYYLTDGFQRAGCGGDLQPNNKIGFWCQWGFGEGSVMMIGGGGEYCSRADHGIGITEANYASFVEQSSTQTEYDFGYDANVQNAPTQSYALNLWILWSY